MVGGALGAALRHILVMLLALTVACLMCMVGCWVMSVAISCIALWLGLSWLVLLLGCSVDAPHDVMVVNVSCISLHVAMVICCLRVRIWCIRLLVLHWLACCSCGFAVFITLLHVSFSCSRGCFDSLSARL